MSEMQIYIKEMGRAMGCHFLWPTGSQTYAIGLPGIGLFYSQTAIFMGYFTAKWLFCNSHFVTLNMEASLKRLNNF